MNEPSTNAAWLDRLQRVECHDGTYRPSHHPLVLARGRGSTLLDAEGREYLDLSASFGALALGHASPSLSAVLHAAADEEALVPGMAELYPSTAKIELCEQLRGLLPPSLDRVSLALTGSQAIEIAMKSAMLATGRHGFVAFEHAYHGKGFGSLALTHRPDLQAPFSAWARPHAVRHLPFGCDPAQVREALRSLAADRCGGAAALVVEPILGRGGMRPAPAGWLEALRACADEAGALLCFDEIFTGLGRSGRMSFAHEVPCDLLCLGKALGGGLPLSACVGRTEVMDRWPRCETEALHTGTFFGHALSCRAGRAALVELERRDLAGRARRLGAWARERLEAAAAELPTLVAVRGEGLALAVDFGQPGLGGYAMEWLRARGIVAVPTGPRAEAIGLTPALTIEQEQLSQGLEAIVEFARELAR